MLLDGSVVTFNDLPERFGYYVTPENRAELDRRNRENAQAFLAEARAERRQRRQGREKFERRFSALVQARYRRLRFAHNPEALGVLRRADRVLSRRR